MRGLGWNGVPGEKQPPIGIEPFPSRHSRNLPRYGLDTLPAACVVISDQLRNAALLPILHYLALSTSPKALPERTDQDIVTLKGRGEA